MTRKVGLALSGCGIVLVCATSVLPGTTWRSLLFRVAWGLLPYIFVFAGAGSRLSPWVVGGVGAATLATDIGTRLSVFVFSRMPLDSVTMFPIFFAPFFITIYAVPGGALAGFLVERAFRLHRVVGRVAAVAAGAGLVLFCLHLASPDLMPWTVAHRWRGLRVFGEPRIVTGGEAFAKTRVGKRFAARRQTGDFDGAPGDEIAIIDYDGIDILDAGDFSRLRRIDAAHAHNAMRWNWFSRLVRSHDRFLVVDIGGGSQETELRDLNGLRLWRYRPEPKAPPTALIPSDLDGDGEIEFYAATSNTVVRLDPGGREVWRRDASSSSLLAVVPPSAAGPAWVVTLRGTTANVLDERGNEIARLTAARAPVLGTIEFPEARSLAVGGESLSLIGIDGRNTFEWTMEATDVVDVASVHLAAGGPRLLAIVGASRDMDRWRLLLVTVDRRVVYDEVFGRPFQLMTARHADGHETLFISADDLEALRPVPTR